MESIKLFKGELAHLYFRDNYIGAISGESTIEILKVFMMNIMLEVNGVRLFADNILIKDVKNGISISSYKVENGELVISKGGK